MAGLPITTFDQPGVKTDRIPAQRREQRWPAASWVGQLENRTIEHLLTNNSSQFNRSIVSIILLSFDQGSTTGLATYPVASGPAGMGG